MNDNDKLQNPIRKNREGRGVSRFRHLIKGDDRNETKAGKGASLILPTYSYLSPVFAED